MRGAGANLGAVLREARERGFSVLWHLGIWEQRPPQPLTDGYIATQENNSSSVADWELKDDGSVVAVRRSDGARLRVFRAI
jgi:hypothetical protein